MSAQGSTEKSPRANSDGKSNNRRRRRPPSSRKPRPASTSEPTTKPVAEASGEEITTTKTPKRPETPIPDHVYGTRVVGTVQSVIRKGRYNFGFILFGVDPAIDENVPRIYFNPSHVTDPDLLLRRRYIVEFLVDKDEEGRSVAKEITLTEEGLIRKAASDEAAAKRRAERVEQNKEASAAAEAGGAAAEQQEEGEGAEKADRPRRTRNRLNRRRGTRPEGKKINLRVSVEGKTEESVIEFDTAQTIGKLKNIAVTAAQAPVEYVVFHKGNFLTKEAFLALEENDVIHLAPQPATEAK